MSVYSGTEMASMKCSSSDIRGKVAPIVTTRSGSGYANGWKTKPSANAKSAALPPMPRASDNTAAIETPDGE